MTRRSIGPVNRAALAALWVYQQTLSRVMPPVCRFTPSCSRYAVEAYRRHRFWRATGLALWRLLRCGPWSEGGVDPVPGTGASDEADARNTGQQD